MVFTKIFIIPTLCLTWLAGSSAALAQQSHPEQGPKLSAADKIAPAEGAALAKAMKPDWCGDYKIKPSNDWTAALFEDDQHFIHLTMKSILKDVTRDPIEQLSFGALDRLRRALIQSACAQPNDPDRQAWVAVWRQAVLNRLPISEEEDRATLAVMTRSLAGNDEARCKTLRTTLDKGDRDPQFDPIWRAQLRVYEQIFQCKWSKDDPTAMATAMIDTGDASSTGAGWLLDRYTQPKSEILRVSFLLSCLQENLTDKIKPTTCGAYAMCGWDGRNLNRTALEEELKNLGVDEDSAGYARDNFARVKGRAQGYTRRLQELAQKKKAFQAILFSAPESAFAEWDKLYSANKDLLDTVYRLEDELSEKGYKAVKGKSGDLRTKFAGFVKAHKTELKTFDDVKKWVAGPVANSALELQTILDTNDGNAAPAIFFRHFLSDLSPLRGPRALAYLRASEALAKAKAEDERFPREIEHLNVNLSFGLLPPNPEEKREWQQVGEPLGSFGVVKAILPGKGDNMHISFRPELVAVPNLSCETTNRISHIDRNGRFVYQQLCHQVGTRTVNVALPTLRMNKVFAKVIKPGMTIQVSMVASGSELEGNQVRDAFPVTGCIGKGCDKLSVFLGYAL